MRLIDADALIEVINEQVKGWGKSGIVPSLFSAIAIVQNQPTAYDLDKVVAELEKLKQHNKELSEGAYLEDDKSFYFCAYTNFARAIEIARKGGVE